MKNDIIVKNGVELRRGLTTGSCATAAAAAALTMLFTKETLESIKIRLPSGDRVELLISDQEIGESQASCSVVKYSGDDPDVTNGMKIFAACSLSSQSEVTITGGKGIGVVTAAGLQVPVGEYAINPVPKSMIKQNISEICESFCYNGGVEVRLSALHGEKIALHTFNPRLGIVGGISILGTTGIVEPMSERALVDTIKLEINSRFLRDGSNILLAPGNYGRDYCKNHLSIDIDNGIKCSNYIGEALDYVRYKGFKRLLLVGHVGKLIKLAGGIMNTHSSYADCRMEIITAYATLAGANSKTAAALMECLTTDTAIDILKEQGILEDTFKRIVDRITFHLDYRLRGSGIQAEVILFSRDEMLVQSAGAAEMARLFYSNLTFD